MEYKIYEKLYAIACQMQTIFANMESCQGSLPRHFSSDRVLVEKLKIELEGIRQEFSQSSIPHSIEKELDPPKKLYDESLWC